MKLIKPSGEAERKTQTTLDTIEVTRKQVAAWASPPFQREIRVTPKVQQLSEEIRQSGVISGVITLGVLDSQVYIVDGQHRLYAFMASDLVLAYADVRTHYFKTMAEMANEFVTLNSSLVRLRPDDILKGLEPSNPCLQKIRKKCPYVGYDAIRRGSTNSPVLSMSTVVRMWAGSKTDVPALQGSVMTCVERMDAAETEALIEFLGTCFEAWHRDVEYSRLWGSLNLILCAWLWRRVVTGDPGRGTSRSSKLSREEFKRGLLSMSASSDYLDYLLGRRISDRDRAPAYVRLKTIIAARYGADHGGAKILLPQPAWAHAQTSRRR